MAENWIWTSFRLITSPKSSKTTRIARGFRYSLLHLHLKFNLVKMAMKNFNIGTFAFTDASNLSDLICVLKWIFVKLTLTCFLAFQLCLLPQKESSHYGKQHWKAMIQKVDSVETEADVVMKCALLPMFTWTFGILPMTSTSFCPKISFLTTWFCQSILLTVISRRSHRVFPKTIGSKLPALFVWCSIS